jgi:hypothetical protein
VVFLLDIPKYSAAESLIIKASSTLPHSEAAATRSAQAQTATAHVYYRFVFNKIAI